MVSMSGLKPSMCRPPNVPEIASAARLASATGSESAGKSQAMTARPAACARGSGESRNLRPYQPCFVPPVRIQSCRSPAAFACATTLAASTVLSGQVVSHMPLPDTARRSTWRVRGTPTGAGRSAVATAAVGGWNGGPGGSGRGGHPVGYAGGAGIGNSGAAALVAAGFGFGLGRAGGVGVVLDTAVATGAG